MEIVAIVIIAIALLAAGWILGTRLRARSHALRIKRDKLESVAAGHREMVASHESSVEELERRARDHRQAAADHARQADELEARIERERRQAQFHEQRAAETEHDRERV